MHGLIWKTKISKGNLYLIWVHCVCMHISSRSNVNAKCESADVTSFPLIKVSYSFSQPQTHYIAKDNLKFLILLLLPVSAGITGMYYHSLSTVVLGTESRALCLIGK